MTAPEDERRPPDQEEAPQVRPEGVGPTDTGNVTPDNAEVQRPITCDVSAAKLFLECVFAELGEGFIEVRVIVDKKGGALVERRWYGAAQELLDDLPRLCTFAATRHAAVFFGVLPRRENGKGKAEDALPGLVAWVDLDFKDYVGGEAEARERLSKFPIPPSIVVRSGHGLHCYWLMREATQPAELSALSKGLAHVLGGDHAFDAARMLRLPGTSNRKDPEHPIPVIIESIEPERLVNPTEIEEALGLFGTHVEGADPGEEDASGGTKTRREGDATRVARPLYPLVLGLLGTERLRGLFEGRGKRELRDDGKPFDQTSSGYDFSLVLALRRKGVKDPDQLANALWNRPDGVAREKGLDYIHRTVEAAVEQFDEFEAARDEQDAHIDFVVDKVRVFASVPPVYEFTIGEKVFTLKTTELLSRDAFLVAFVNTHRRIPSLPHDWAEQVGVWLALAEIVEQPPEASDEQALRDAVQRVIDDLPVGEEAVDLDHGKAVLLEDGRKAFKADSVLKLILEDFKSAKRYDLCRVLKNIGFESVPRKVGKDRVQVRLWAPIGNA